MLPMFFEMTWGLTPTVAGMIAASFAFVNLIARPIGGLVSDRFGNRRFVMLAYMIGIAIGFALMGLMGGTWPLIRGRCCYHLVFRVCARCRRGNLRHYPFQSNAASLDKFQDMAGAYGNVGAVFYLTLYTFVTPSQFFFIIAAGALLSFIACLFWLKEPEGAFAEEYIVSSVDLKLAADQKTGKL